MAEAELGRGERCESLRWDLGGGEPGLSLTRTLFVQGGALTRQYIRRLLGLEAQRLDGGDDGCRTGRRRRMYDSGRLTAQGRLALCLAGTLTLRLSTRTGCQSNCQRIPASRQSEADQPCPLVPYATSQVRHVSGCTANVLLQTLCSAVSDRYLGCFL